MTMGTRVLIGREKELRLLSDLVRSKKNVLVLGEEGVGKSAIINHTIASGVLKNFLYSKHSATLKEALVNLVGEAVGGKELAKQNILTLKKVCYRLLNGRPEYAVFDHVAYVERRFYAFLTYLREGNLPVVIVSQKRGKDNLGHLWMGLYDFEVLEVKNLDPTEAGQLVDHYISRLDLKIEAAADFKKDVFKMSQGNPKIIQDLCRLARNDRYRAKGYIDVKLMDLDRRISSIALAAAESKGAE
jgi:AAA+ ATPase superfamily predicted ATPase